MKDDIAESMLLEKLRSLQERVGQMFYGNEKLATLEIIRSLDLIFTRERTSEAPADEGFYERYFARCGVPEALMPFMKKAHQAVVGVPWTASDTNRSIIVQKYIVECGKLVDLLRLVRLARHGLTSVTTLPGYIKISVKSDAPERAAVLRRRDIASSILTDSEVPSLAPIDARMREMVRHDELFFIDYETDNEIEEYFYLDAQRMRVGCPESEAFPDDCVIGERTFAEWREECERACARILRHAHFSKLLCEGRAQSNLRDCLTMFYRKSDVEEMLVRAGTPSHLVVATARALTTLPEDLQSYSDAYEPPATPYISLDGEFVVAPCYGMISNPYFSMFTHLRSAYRKDWDRAVDSRELAFRNEVRRLFPGPRFVVPTSGFKIKREDGSLITDIDAVVCDRETGGVALMQLKWHDPYGRSISERESRRRNLAKASDWVTRVSQWVGSRNCIEISRSLGLERSQATSLPELFVVSRYASRFVGDDRSEHRSTWVSWPELVHAVAQFPGDPIGEIPVWARRGRSSHSPASIHSSYFYFPDLEVRLDVDVAS
ncbi:hypothetical protein [Stenotrophomonas rhizophila]